MLARNVDIKRGIEDISRKVQEKNRILQRIEDDLKKADKANLMANQDYEEVLFMLYIQALKSTIKIKSRSQVNRKYEC